MNFEIRFSREFQRRAKKLSKKYPSFKKDIEEIAKSLSNDPYQGVVIGPNTYKVRFKISSKGKGKSGGGRLITYVRVVEVETTNIINVITVYDKSEIASVPYRLIKELISDLLDD
ncbi:MAG: hypothetical protein AAF741_09660 [Bacteroidota bacterium]